MCQADPSEFVRRAAVDFICRWHCTETTPIACLIAMCEAVVRDVDCDVKCAAVRFWRQYLRNINQSVASLCCRTAVLAGSVSCLLLAVSDCDRTVRVEALRSLVDTRRLVETQPALLLPAKRCAAGKFFDDSSCDRICSNPDFINASVRHLPRNFDSEWSLDEGRSREAVNWDDASGDELTSVTDTTYTVSTLTKLRVALLNTNWDSLLTSESQQSDDCHAGNPVSLLDDILKTARRENEMSAEKSDDSQDSIIIDCY